MADDDGFDTVRVIAEVPRATRDIVKEKYGYGGITTVIKDALMDAAHGEAANEKVRLKQSLEETRAEIRELKRERADLDDRIDEKEATAARLEDQLDAIRDREGEYEGALAIIEQDLLEGIHIFPDFPAVKRAATLAGVPPEQVIEDLRSRNPQLPEEQFRPKQEWVG